MKNTYFRRMAIGEGLRSKQRREEELANYTNYWFLG